MLSFFSSAVYDIIIVDKCGSESDFATLLNSKNGQRVCVNVFYLWWSVAQFGFEPILKFVFVLLRFTVCLYL